MPRSISSLKQADTYDDMHGGMLPNVDAAGSRLDASYEDTPSGQSINPFSTGMQMGVLGAAAGVGIAGIHRALRLKMGDRTPVAVYKPMLIGATIGAALGGIGSYKAKKHKAEHNTNPAGSWAEVGSRMVRNTPISKYAGLRRVVGLDKRAQDANMALETAKIPLYFVPGVGTALTAWDAAKGYGRGISNLARGNFRQGAAGMASGVGNTLGALATLFTGGTNLLSGGAKAIKGVSNLSRLGKATMAANDAGHAATLGMSKLAPLYRRLSPLADKVPQSALATAERWGSKLQPYSKYQTPVGFAGAGLAVGGGIAEAMPPGGAPVQAVPNYLSHRFGTQHAGSHWGQILNQPSPFPKFEVPRVDWS